MINTHDKTLIAQKGLTLEIVNNQLERFSKGFDYLKLSAPASIEHGILQLNPKEIDYFTQVWDKYLVSKHSVVKFVPASGAASRMFKSLFEFLSADYDEPTTDDEKFFFEDISCFAFYNELNTICIEKEGKGVTELLQDKSYKSIVSYLLTDKGLNYGNLPKGLLSFHKSEDGVRTPFEEHLVEGALYAKQDDGVVNLHYTISASHRKLFDTLLKRVLPFYEEKFGVIYNVKFSYQQESTDTIAVTLENEPFRIDGALLFRPGGHGALIKNLDSLIEDVIFIKNIDNVVPDHLKEETISYKKTIAGLLVDTQAKIFKYLELLESGQYTHEQVIEVLQFVQKKLFCKNPETKYLEDSVLVLYLIGKLDRPLRVCGVVRNTGEAGGGPFLVYNPDGTISSQILESSQIDMKNENDKEMFLSGTHFNPVDLVCGVYDRNGNKYRLLDHVDSETGFISQKSQNGKELKALELPGLWNGAMSDWNTIFVEVPSITFNPVKTVNDLLRKEHQAK